MKNIKLIAMVLVIVVAVLIVVSMNNNEQAENNTTAETGQTSNDVVNQEPLDPFTIEAMKAREYPGSEFVIEQNLGNKGRFTSYVVSYLSDGLKLYALMCVPNGEKPVNGWPVLILNHGFIPPTTYDTINSYKAFMDYYSNNGLLVLKPDYRGHDNSEGEPQSAHISADYTTDVLNLVSSVKKYPDADDQKIAMWGHSMGGGITLRALIVSKDIKAGLLIAGVVASPQNLYQYWLKNNKDLSIPGYINTASETLVARFGLPNENPDAWNSISPYSHLDDIGAPVSIHHGTADASVPIEFSEEINSALTSLNKSVEYFVYQGADHNIANVGRSLLLTRTLNFININLQ